MIPLKDDIPSRSFPLFNILLIIANIVVFFYELTLSPLRLRLFFYQYGVVPYYLWQFDLPLRNLLTSMFLHGGWVHLLGNMLYLWIFGDNVEDRMGHFRYLIFYILAGIFASLVQSLVSPFSKVPMIGASGAISGVLGAYLVFFPYARVLTLVPLFFFINIIAIPAFVFIPFWFLLQLFNGILSLPASFAGRGGGVAWFAHIGGFIFGLVFAKIFCRKRYYYWNY